MMVEITCPKCNFSKKIPKAKIPDKARWATCPRCKQRFEFALIDPDISIGQREEQQNGENRIDRVYPPWETRSELGLWKSVYQTTRAVLFSPEDLFCNMIFKAGIKEPLAFGLLLGSVGAMFGIFWQFLVLSGSLTALNLSTSGQLTMSMVFLALIIIAPLFVIISMFLTSSILHLLLLLVKGRGNAFEATFRVVSYSQATQLLGLFPFIGGLIGFLWMIIVQIIGLKEIHETSYLKVIIAFLIPPALILLLVMAIVVPLFILGHR
jgi:hypothetical protein